MTMTPTAPHTSHAGGTAFPPAVTERLNRIRPHVAGLPGHEVAQMVEQAFRNFPGIDTATLVNLLADPTT